MNDHETELIQNKPENSTHNRFQRFNVVLVCIGIAYIFCCLGCAIGFLAGEFYGTIQRSESLSVINRDDPFIAGISEDFDLPRVLQQYDQVIFAIDKYHKDYGFYPPELTYLVPDYLSQVPGIYIRRGNRLTYDPNPERLGAAPFTFSISGHYPGLAFIHGWELKYCPIELVLCNETDDRHFHPSRINDRWIWIGSSAL